MSKSLFGKLSVVSSMTFISRILGFVRDLFAAQFFGVNASVDAFYIAFKIPNFMRNLFAEGSFSQAFVPVLSEYRSKHSENELRLFISHMAGSLGLVLLFVSVLGVVFSGYLVDIFSPGLDPYRFKLASEILKITFPYLMLISLTAFSAAILNSLGSFAIPALTPALLNVSLIASAIFLSGSFVIPVKSQAWGVLVAGFLQLLIQLIALSRLGFLVRPKVFWQDPGLKKVLRLIVPAIFGASLGQISIMINTILASFLPTGSVTWLYYSERLAYFPLGIFGVAIATVILPHLSRKNAESAPTCFNKALEWGLKWNLIIGIPASITLFVLSGPLVIALFSYGKFSPHDVFMTQRAVNAYAFGLQAFMLFKLLSSAFYAKQNIKTVVRVSMIALLVNLLLSLILIHPLAHAGLALSTSVSSWVSVLILMVILFRSKILIGSFDFLKFLIKLVFINIILFLYLSFMSHQLEFILTWNGSKRFLHIFFIGVSSMVIYLLALYTCSVFPRNIE